MPQNATNHSLATLNDDQLLLRRSSGKDNFSVVSENVVQLLLAHVLQFLTVNNGGLGVTWVHIFNGNIQTAGNVLNGFGTYAKKSKNCQLNMTKLNFSILNDCQIDIWIDPDQISPATCTQNEF